MIHDVVYTYLKKHKSFIKLKSEYNIYDALIKFVSNPKRDTGLMGKYRNYQDVFIESENFEPEPYSQEEFNSLPASKYSPKKKRIRLDTNRKKEWIRIDKNTIIENKNDYMLVDPKINKDNKERILKLVDLFVKYTLKSK